MYRIVSFDGGGVKGVITARLLDRIDKEVPGFLQSTNLFAGTSTGAILAATIALGKTPSELVELYRDKSEDIFKQTALHKIRNIFGLTEAKYSTENRKAVIQPYVGDATLDDILPVNLFIASFQLDNNPQTVSDIRKWKSKFFHNFPGSDSDGSEKVIDVVLRSSAPPVFFPTYQGYVDGAMVANNPSLCALADTLHNSKGQQQLENIKLLSFGTGTSSDYINVQNANWGLRQWGMNLVNIILDCGDDLPDYQCSQLLSDSQYHRLQPILDNSYGIDSWKDIQSMINLADKVDISDTVNWIKANW